MPEFEKIAVINVGWSDDYRGAQVRGNFGYVSSHGEGHERFNFDPAPDGTYYGYVPPLGEAKSPPKPDEDTGWLVFFVSKRPSRNGLYLVGWYEDARFERAYLERPDADRLGPALSGGNFIYTVRAPRGVSVPLALRKHKVTGSHLKRSYAYLRGNNAQKRWRQQMANDLLEARSQIIEDLQRVRLGDDQARVLFCADATRRRQIEENAVEAVKAAYGGWDVLSMEAEKCGYDLHFTSHTTGEIHHVEVKGTSLPAPAFFMTENERLYAEKTAKNDRRARKDRDGNWRPLWRLAVVSDVLGSPKVQQFTYAEMNRAFDLDCYAWRGTLKETD